MPQENLPAALALPAAVSGQHGAWHATANKLWSSVPFLWCVVLIVYALPISQDLKKIDRQSDRTLGNFSTFRDAAIAMSYGQDIYASGKGEYIYPPLIAFLYQPLGRMPLAAAALVGLAVNLVLSLASLWLAGTVLSRRFLGRATPLAVARIAAVAALLTADKIRAEFHMWETNVLMLFLITVALAYARRRPTLAGAALGLAFNIKYLPLTLLPLLLLRRRWRMAGAFAGAALAFALLPALTLGWRGNLAALAAAYSGLAGLFAITVHHAAHVFPMTDIRSFSATSGIARLTGWRDQYALAAAAALGLCFVTAALLTYKRNRLPKLRWPVAALQTAAPFSALFSLEWVAVILLTLIFSPFTNSQHLYLLLLANATGAALLLSDLKPAGRWTLIAGLAVMYLGITLPPGGEFFHTAQNFSKWIGLPAWSMLVYCAALIWAGLPTVNTPPNPSAEPAVVGFNRVDSPPNLG